MYLVLCACNAYFATLGSVWVQQMIVPHSEARLRYLQMRSRVLESLHPPNLPEREA